MAENQLAFENEAGLPFVARIVFEGDRYGLDWRLEHSKEEPFVEFYDARHKPSAPEADPDQPGQFVSRYQWSILNGTSRWSTFKDGDGLLLEGGVPEWSVDGEAMSRVLAWARETIDRAQVPAPGR